MKIGTGPERIGLQLLDAFATAEAVPSMPPANPDPTEKVYFTEWGVQRHAPGWKSEKARLKSWALSVSLAARWYRPCLVTDTAGARLLADTLQLPFATVSTALEGLRPSVGWTAGKLSTYQHALAVGQPFTHLDFDVYLWKPLPSRITTARVGCQHFETLEWYLKTPTDPLPPAKAVTNCATLHFNDLALCSDYLTAAFQFVATARGDPHMVGTVAEQMVLASVCERRGIQPVPLFPSSFGAGSPFDDDATAEVGYTHLQGYAKKLRVAVNLLSRACRRVCPVPFERIERLLPR